jgi:hypothetical protein
MVFTSFVKYFNNIVVQLANLYVESDEARSMLNMLNRWGRVLSPQSLIVFVNTSYIAICRWGGWCDFDQNTNAHTSK